MTNTDTSYPLPHKVIEDYVRQIFTPVLVGECATTVWVASAGRRLINKFVIENINLFKKYLPNPERYLIAYIEPLDLTEDSLSGYLRLIGSTLIRVCSKNENYKNLIDTNDAAVFEDEDSSYTKLLNALDSFIQRAISSNREVILFLGEFDELNFVDTRFCNNLRSLWNKFDTNLHYIFLIKEVSMIFERGKVGEDLSENFLQNVVYFPISDENSKYLISRFSTRLQYEFSRDELAVLNSLCDGHPYFLKVACSLLAKNNGKKMSTNELEELIQKNYELRAVAKRIMEVQTEKAKDVLKKIVVSDVTSLTGEEEKTLKLLGLVKFDPDGKYRLFCQLFEDAVLKRAMPKAEFQGSNSGLTFDAESNSLFWQDKPVEEKFTPQEYETLTFLMKEPNKLRSREQIGEILWGNDSYDKYSDWAIDQLISKLRKKMENLGVGRKKLITIRGKGYKFID